MLGSRVFEGDSNRVFFVLFSSVYPPKWTSKLQNVLQNGCFWDVLSTKTYLKNAQQRPFSSREGNFQKTLFFINVRKDSTLDVFVALFFFFF